MIPSGFWKWLAGIGLVVLALLPGIQEGFAERDDTEKSADLVIAHYNENLDWLDKIPHQRFRRIIVYTKGDALPNCSRYWCEVIPIHNVGREGHSYLHHIITNYETLADVTVFLPGSCFVDHKRPKTEKIVLTALQDKDTVMLSQNRVENVAETLKDFEIKQWASSHPDNRTHNPEADLAASRIRPFGKWYKHFFGDVVVHDVFYSGIFAVSREVVHNRPVAFYESLERELSSHSNPEAGHYVERAWPAIFHPVPTDRFV